VLRPWGTVVAPLVRRSRSSTQYSTGSTPHYHEGKWYCPVFFSWALQEEDKLGEATKQLALLHTLISCGLY